MVSIVTLVSLGATLIIRDYLMFKKESAKLRQTYVNDQKSMIKNEVEKVFSLVTYHHSQTEERLRASIKMRTNEAITIAQGLYDRYQGRMSASQLRQVVWDALRPIRFNSGRGYYFAVSMAGFELLNGDHPEIEGRNMLASSEQREARVVGEMIELVKKDGEGFYRYLWTKPNRSGAEFMKVAFVKYFAPFDCFIGTGEYLDDVENDIKRELLAQIGKIRFGRDGYIFVVSYQGVTLMNGVQPNLIGKDMWEMTDPYGVKVIQLERAAVENPVGDFINYHWEKPTTKKISPKISFLRGYLPWQWMIGAGVYADEVETEIAKIQRQTWRNAERKMLIMGALLVVMLAAILGLSFMFSRHFSRRFNMLTSFIQRMEKDDTPIDTTELIWNELVVLGESANKMLATRRQAEEQLKERTEELERYFSTALDLFCIADFNGVLRRVNRQWESTFGYSIAELEGRQALDLVHPDDLEATKQVLAKLGDHTPVVNFVNRYRCKDGSYRWIEWRAYPSDNVMFAAARDITERKAAEAEKAQLEVQLQQAMKMEAVGRLAGGVAHDFNNLLTGITGNVSLALLDLTPGDPLAATLEEIQIAAKRASELTRQLLAFSRKQIIEPKVVDLNEMIAGLHKMLVRLIGEDIVLNTIPGEALGSVRIDPGQFEQIIVNLVVNARDAMPNGGELIIETSAVLLDNEYCRHHADATPGWHVMLAVSDTGVGMSEEVKRHLFEPFFTTKPKGHGTGLGLATIYGAVRQAGGSVQVYSELGHGTTFKIYLPRLEEAAESTAFNHTGSQLVGGHETILVVEDEATVRNLANRLLNRLGYRVLQAADGVEALALAKDFAERIDLLLTDVVMPGMNGRQLAEQLKPIHPETKVLYTSGYTENVVAHHGVVEEGLHFIGKPYTPPELARKIRDALRE